MLRYPSRLCYCVLLIVVLFDCAGLAFTNAAVQPKQIAAYLLTLVPLLSITFITSKVQFTGLLVERICFRISHLCQGLVFLLVGWVAIRVFNHLSMKLTSGIGYVDPFLAWLDRLLMLEWVAYYGAVQSHSWAIEVLDQSYTSLSLLSVIALIVISFSNDARRSEFFLEAFFLTAVICTVIGMFFPAQGTVMHYLGPEGEFPGFATAPGIWFIEPLSELRSDRSVLLDITDLPGLVTFPSFHVAAVIVVAASFWRTALFPPVLLYSLVVTAATPVFGGHYIIDLLAGAVVASLVVAVLVRTARFDGLFAGSRPVAVEEGVTGEVLQ